MNSLTGSSRAESLFESTETLPEVWDEDEEPALAVPKIRRVEAVLFLSKEGVSSRKLAKLAGLADATEARTLIRQLNDGFDANHSPYRVEEIAGGYILLTRSEFAPWLGKLGHVSNGKRLSQTAMETLAIVAYRQPVLRAEIEAIRGVSCSEILKQLMEQELVRISGRSEDLGRPYLYGTTRRFLQMFGLRSVDRLPRMAWVNEPQFEHAVVIEERQSEAEDSAMTRTLPTQVDELGLGVVAGETLASDADSATALATKGSGAKAVDDDDDGWIDEDDEDFGDDEDDDDFDDDEWADEEDEDDGEDDDDDNGAEDDEEESEWQEVGDDDDGWVEEDDEEEEDDDWEEEEGEDEDWD
ncbi:MAG: SMC-Scp complex subunit ScpB [Planctomycetota bacterium]